jgi:hypothetical protein
VLLGDQRNSVYKRSEKSSASRRSEEQCFLEITRRAVLLAVLLGDQRNSVVYRSAKSSAARRSEEHCCLEIREEQCCQEIRTQCCLEVTIDQRLANSSAARRSDK